ncbi:MAG: hypothetical protein JRI71_11120 [Deltaproteobacteria bacterium]|nr:hypothetical protein [Deltaproteobacteria bacterium]MBW2311978.1 hypothetical protein [Deltaproteobacteria bacterium]
MSKPIKNSKHPSGRKKLGERLVDCGLIDKKSLANALEIHKKKIGQILIERLENSTTY